jgi:xanthine dehydrogenase accessory factor
VNFRLVAAALGYRQAALQFGFMEIYDEIAALLRSGGRGALATIVNAQGSVPSFRAAKLLVREDGTTLGTVGGGSVEAEVLRVAREVIRKERPQTLTFNLNDKPQENAGLTCGGQLQVFIEPLIPAPELYILGAGHIAMNLCRVAALAGFEISVVDDRQEFANSERFPHAKHIIAEQLESALPKLQAGPNTFIVIASRGHGLDLVALRWAAATGALYIGMVGSRKKSTMFLRELEGEGIPAEKLARVNTPVGLDIGAITPEEIAVAITAEMIAVRRGVETGKLSLRLARKQ